MTRKIGTKMAKAKVIVQALHPIVQDGMGTTFLQIDDYEEWPELLKRQVRRWARKQMAELDDQYERALNLLNATLQVAVCDDCQKEPETVCENCGKNLCENCTHQHRRGDFCYSLCKTCFDVCEMDLAAIKDRT